MADRRTRTAACEDARRLLAKAEEFAASARAELLADRFSAAGLAAVHAGISAADAVTAHKVGAVSAAPNHMEAVGFVRDSLCGKMPPVNRRQLVGLLNAKNEVEYSGSPLQIAQAKMLVDQATRFVAWAGVVVESG